MAYIVNTNIENQTNGYLLDAKNVKGGYIVVSSITERDSLPAATIVNGSLCYVTGTSTEPINKFYQYDGQNWVEAQLGGAGIEAGEGENSIQQVGTGSKAVGIESFAAGHNTTAAGKASSSTGFSNALASNNPNFAADPVAAWHKARNRKRGINWETGVIIPGPTADQKAAYENATTAQKRLDLIAAADYKVSDEMTSEKLDAEDYARNFTYVSGLGAHVEGLNTLATGKGAHAEGSRTYAAGSRAHSEGTDTSAVGNNAHAEGQDSIAKGVAAHAEGYDTVAGTHGSTGGGEGAHSEGTYTKALATASHAEGTRTEARATASHTEGAGTVATREYQHVQGKYNYLDADGDAGNYAHIIGSGTSSKRENIHTVDWSGNAWYKGNLEVGGTVSDGEGLTLSKINKRIVIKYGTPDGGSSTGAIGLAATEAARYSLAIGYQNKVTTKSTNSNQGGHGVALGANAWAIDGQIALGMFNNPEATYKNSENVDKTAVFMVGSGWSEKSRTNAFAVLADGTGYLGNRPIVTVKKPSVGLDYTLTGDGSAYIVSGIGTCTDTDIIIPATYMRKPVTSIGGTAFIYSSITSVVIPEGVTSIGSGAFVDCNNLTSVEIPDSVTSIGYQAFWGCDSLRSVVIPGSVTSIESSAFNYCTSLTIYCETTEKPGGWVADWNSSNCPVVWGAAASLSTPEESINEGAFLRLRKGNPVWEVVPKAEDHTF